MPYISCVVAVKKNNFFRSTEVQLTRLRTATQTATCQTASIKTTCQMAMRQNKPETEMKIPEVRTTRETRPSWTRIPKYISCTVNHCRPCSKTLATESINHQTLINGQILHSGRKLKVLQKISFNNRDFQNFHFAMCHTAGDNNKQVWCSGHERCQLCTLVCFYLVLFFNIKLNLSVKMIHS